MSTSVLISSQSFFLATAAAMAVSGAVIFLSLIPRQQKQKSTPTSSSSATKTTTQFNQTHNPPPLRSCLSSPDGKMRERKAKKRVKFAEDVKEKSEQADATVTAVKEQKRRRCRREVPVASMLGGMPANRVALYRGILRDRVHRIQCSY